jgi:hypothetical protein
VWACRRPAERLWIFELGLIRRRQVTETLVLVVELSFPADRLGEMWVVIAEVSIADNSALDGASTPVLCGGSTTAETSRLIPLPPSVSTAIACSCRGHRAIGMTTRHAAATGFSGWFGRQRESTAACRESRWRSG